jgi:hypothetical protein
MYLYATSYRKKGVKFPNNLLNDEKEGIDCCCSRLSVRRVHTAHRVVATKSRDTAAVLESLFQRGVPSATLGVCRRFVVAVFEITKYER